MSEIIKNHFDKINQLFQEKKNIIQESKIIEKQQQLPQQIGYSEISDFHELPEESNLLKEKIQKAKQKDGGQQLKKKVIRDQKINQKQKLKNPVCVRKSAGEIWVDNSMADWPEGDYRLFVGNLGNEVTDTVLSNAFRKYNSFARAKVIRCKRSMKTKGYGFVSLLDPNDYLKAFKEMDGGYVGNRPCKLSKSKWADRQGTTNTKDDVFDTTELHPIFKKPPKLKKQKIKGFTTYAIDQNPFEM